MKKFKYIKNPEQLQAKLEQIITEIHSVEDPHMITEYRKFFKTHTSFFNRSLIAGYILKKYIDNGSALASSRRNPTQQRSQSSNRLNNAASASNPQKNIRQSSSRPNDNKPNNNSSDANRPDTRQVSINVGSSQASESEILEYLNDLPSMKNAEVTLVRQAERYTVFTIKQETVSDLLNDIKTRKLKGKKPYINLRAR